MKIKAVLDKNGNKIGEQIILDIEGAGGNLGVKCVKKLLENINEFKKVKTQQEASAAYKEILGYLDCCIDSGYLDANSGNETRQLADYILHRIAKSAAF